MEKVEGILEEVEWKRVWWHPREMDDDVLWKSFGRIWIYVGNLKSIGEWKKGRNGFKSMEM